MSKKLFIHHDGYPNHRPTLAQINEYHKRKWGWESDLINSPYPYIAYHFFIDQSGNMTQCRSIAEGGPHTKNHNDDIAVCLSGNFSEPYAYPTTEQIKTLRELYDLLRFNGTVTSTKDVFFHKSVRNTECPGNNLNLHRLRRMLEPSAHLSVAYVLADGVDRDEFHTAQHEVRNWVRGNSASRIYLMTDIIETNIDPTDVHWRDKFIKRNWFDLNVTARAPEDADIVMFVSPKDGWLNKKLLGYMHYDPRLGAYCSAMQTRGGIRTRADNRFNNEQVPGTLSHELVHILGAMTGLRKPNEGQEQQYQPYRYDNTHFFDYHVDDRAYQLLTDDPRTLSHTLLWDIDHTKLKPRPTKNVLYKYTGTLTHRTTELDPQHVFEGRAYRTRDARHFFKYTPEGWKVSHEEEYNNTHSRLIVAPSTARWMYEQAIPNKKERTKAIQLRDSKPSGIKMTTYETTFQKLFYLLGGWQEGIPTDHLDN